MGLIGFLIVTILVIWAVVSYTQSERQKTPERREENGRRVRHALNEACERYAVWFYPDERFELFRLLSAFGSVYGELEDGDLREFMQGYALDFLFPKPTPKPKSPFPCDNGPLVTPAMAREWFQLNAPWLKDTEESC